MLKNLEENLTFINISTESSTIFEWKPKGSHKSFALDLNLIRSGALMDEIFFHIHRGNTKIVYIKKKSLIYTIGSNTEIQFQILEAILEEVDKMFHEIYDPDVIISYGNVAANTFDGFIPDVEDIINNFENLNSVQQVKVFCKVCNKLQPLFIKKHFIQDADSYPVSIVFDHKGHAILCYIDKNFEVRGVELVNITG